MKMSQRRREEFESIPEYQRFNERAVDLGKTVAETPVNDNDSTIGSIALNRALEHFARDTNRRAHYLTIII